MRTMGFDYARHLWRVLSGAVHARPHGMQLQRVNAAGRNEHTRALLLLGRLYEQLVIPRQQELVEALVSSLLHDGEVSVRDEARTALEQLEDPLVLQRLQTLVDEGFLS